MKELYAKAIINADAEIVFNALSDVSSYPIIDTNCEKIDGDIKRGKYLYLYHRLGPRGAVKVFVKEMTPFEVMVWELKFPMNLCHIVRSFLIIAKDDQTTELHIKEIHSGIFAKYIAHNRAINQDNLTNLAKGVKQFIESRP